MTRAEYEAQLEGRVFTCRGARVYTADVVATALAATGRSTAEGLAADIASAVAELESTEVDRLLEVLIFRGMTEAARVLDSASREPCGLDVRPLILAAPLDGEFHETPCPKCGNLLQWSPPVIEG